MLFESGRGEVGSRAGRKRRVLGRLRRLVPLGTVAGATGAADKARVPEEAAVPVTVLVFCARLAARVRGRVRRRRRRRGHAGTEAERARHEVALTALEVAARGAVPVARAWLVARVGRRRRRRRGRPKHEGRDGRAGREALPRVRGRLGEERLLRLDVGGGRVVGMRWVGC